MKQRQISSTSYDICFFMVLSIDHLTGATGKTPTVTLSKNGGAFGATAGAISEIGNGWYKLAGNATDRNTLGELLLHATATGCDPLDEKYEIVTHNPFVEYNFNPAADTVAQVTTTVNLTTNTDKTGYGLADDAITAAKIAANAITDSEISAAAANKIADHTLRRSLTSALVSADGDVKGFRSLAGAVAKLVDRIHMLAGTLTVYETDDLTALGTQTVTTTATADPVTQLDTV